MTSEEALINLSLIPISSITPERYKELLDIIAKDLCVLKIIKKHSSIVEMYSTITKLGEHFVCETQDKEELKILKGWLDDENKIF